MVKSIVYKMNTKHHVGNICYKARGVAMRNKQGPRLGYDKTFALVVMWSTVRQVTTLVAAFGWSISQMDVVVTFLNGTLEGDYLLAPTFWFQSWWHKTLGMMS